MKPFWEKVPHSVRLCMDRLFCPLLAQHIRELEEEEEEEEEEGKSGLLNSGGTMDASCRPPTKPMVKKGASILADLPWCLTAVLLLCLTWSETR